MTAAIEKSRSALWFTAALFVGLPSGNSPGEGVHTGRWLTAKSYRSTGFAL